jgi:3-oxoacyl-[acyl-carrier protein] reductase
MVVAHGAILRARIDARHPELAAPHGLGNPREGARGAGRTGMRLEGKVAIITGGGSGFGEGMARRFAAEGARVVVADIDAANGERVAAAIRDAGGAALSREADVAKASGARDMARAALDAWGRIDIMVNNAGYTHRNQSMMNVGEEAFDRIFDVNVKAIYLAALEVVPVFRRQGGGAILTTASTAGLRPRPGLTIYNASKGAAIAMTKSMAVEFAPDRIRVNCLCPVAGETAMLADFMGGDTPENRARFKASVPLGRLSLPEDIANAALYLCSDEASFITGVALEVDGGRCV